MRSSWNYTQKNRNTNAVILPVFFWKLILYRIFKNFADIFRKKYPKSYHFCDLNRDLNGIQNTSISTKTAHQNIRTPQKNDSKHSEVFRSIQMHSQSFRRIQKHPEVSTHTRKRIKLILAIDGWCVSLTWMVQHTHKLPSTIPRGALEVQKNLKIAPILF